MLRKTIGIALMAGLIVLLPSGVKAQAIIGIIKGAITKVIKAMDLEVQRMQTSTVFLQEAQKTVENAMSELDLSEIEGWVQAQKDLYGDYFQELWKVKTILSYYHKIEEIMQRQEQLLASYKRAYTLFRQDSHFTADELKHMESVYEGILKESSKNLDQLMLVINSFSTQMSDAARLAIIDKTGASMDRNFDNLNRFNNQNALLSLQRATDQNDYVKATLTELGTFDLNNPVSEALLFQTGYLTIKSYNPKSGICELGYPNKEVENSLKDALLSTYREIFPKYSSPITEDISEALIANDIPTMISDLNTLISTIPYDHWKAESESIFHIIFHLALTRLGMDIRSKAHSAHGRCDVLVQTSAYVYAIELKLNGSAQEGLDQIFEKNYLRPFQSDPRKKVAIGINFSTEKRAVDEYLVEELS